MLQVRSSSCSHAVEGGSSSTSCMHKHTADTVREGTPASRWACARDLAQEKLNLPVEWTRMRWTKSVFVFVFFCFFLATHSENLWREAGGTSRSAHSPAPKELNAFPMNGAAGWRLVRLLRCRACGRVGSGQQSSKPGQLRNQAATTARHSSHVGAKEGLWVWHRYYYWACACVRGRGLFFFPCLCGYRLHGRATGLLRDGEPDREPQQGCGVSKGAE